MTLEQIQYLREQFNKDNGNGAPVANSVHYYLDNNIAMRNVGDFVIFDDANELVHCISANRHQFIKNESPFAVLTGSYADLQFTEANLTLEGLMTCLDEMFASLIDENQKKQITNWAQQLPVKPINTVKATYFKDEAPRIPNRPITVITRPDGVHNGYPVVSNKKSDVIKAVAISKAVETLSKVEDGATVSLSGGEITEAMTISADNVTVTAKEVTTENTVTIESDGVTLKGLTLSAAADATSSDNIVVLNGDNTTFDTCSFYTADSSVRTAVVGYGSTYTFEDCVFDGENNIYNGIEIGIGTNADPIKSITFKNCIFTEEFTTNNFVSLYSFVDGATVNFIDCAFSVSKSSNVLRLSNNGNHTATINFINCVYTKTVESGQYDGVVLLQDYSKDQSQDMTLFTINFINLIDGTTGEKIMENGTGIKTIWYTYGVQEGMEPVVNFS